MSGWYRNGTSVDSIPIDDRAVQYGDGLFETIAIRAGKPRLFDLHLERLERGCVVLGIEMPDASKLENDLASAIEQSQETPAHSVAKIVVSSGVSQRGYGRKKPSPASVVIGVFPSRPVAAESYREGVNTILCTTRLAVYSATAGLKSLNRIEQVLGRSECLTGDAFEGLMLDAEERLICGTMSNVFIAVDKTIVTPSLDRCGVEGVMRSFAIQSLAAEGIEVSVRDVALDEFRDCEEVFLTNSQFGALPIRQCDGKTLVPGRLTREVTAILARNGITECAL